MTNNHPVVLETDVRFADSILWEAQREFFSSKGIHAWDHSVPFYITSNPYIAKCYARVVIRYIQELHRNKQLNLTKPVYIFELGCGSGKFSFYFLKHLFSLQQSLRLQEVPICYVMTDFTQLNVDFWNQSGHFSQYIEKQQLDFAVFDIEHDSEITLQKSKITLQKDDIKNPAIIIANYVFDTVRHDIFHVESGQLNETLVTTTVQNDNYENGKVKNLDNIENSFKNVAIQDNFYYKDPHFDSVLMQYKKWLNGSTFLYPIGALKFLQNMRKLTASDMMVITTDKAYSHLSELDNLSPPSIAFHGSFSMMVNLHAIGEYVHALGGYVKHQDIRDGIKTSLFLLGRDLGDMPETTLAVEDFINDFGPADFFNLYQYCKEDNITPKAISAELQLSGWDPYIFSAQVRKMLPQVNSMGAPLTQYFVDHFPNLENNFYRMPGESDAYFDIGIFLQSVGHHSDAMDYFEKSLDRYGDNFATYYNLGLCCFYLSRYDAATTYLRRADVLEQGTTQAKDLLKEIETRGVK